MPETTPTSAARVRLPREERMGQMLTAAHRLFAQRGYNAVTMDDIATAVGVTKPLLYTYFGNKERLYLACLEEAAEGLIVTITEAITASPLPRDALADGIRAFFAFVADNHAAWAVLFDETIPNSGEIADRVARYREQILDAVSAAALAQMPPEAREGVRVETEVVATAIIGAVEATGRWWTRGQLLSHRYTAEILIAMIGPGLAHISARPSNPGALPA